MLVTLSGIVMLVRLVQLNAPFPMLVTLSGIVTLVRPVQPQNAPFPMLVTLSGIVTLVRPVQPIERPAPDAGDRLPSMVSGITTSPPGPVYPVMVTVPPMDLVIELSLHHGGQGQAEQAQEASEVWRCSRPCDAAKCSPARGRASNTAKGGYRRSI
jgi:hypothetical protein